MRYVCVYKRMGTVLHVVCACCSRGLYPSIRPPAAVQTAPPTVPPPSSSLFSSSLCLFMCVSSLVAPPSLPPLGRGRGDERGVGKKGERVRDCGERSSEQARAGDGRTTNSQRSQSETRRERRAFFCLRSSSPPRQLTCGWPRHQPVVRKEGGFCTL